MRRFHRRFAAWFLIVAAGVVLAGCNASFHASTGDPGVSSGELERQIETILAKKVDARITATCDGGMKAKKGAKKYCTGVAKGTDGLKQKIRVKVRSVTDTKARLNVVILQQANPAAAAASVQKQLVAAGESDAKVSCPKANIDLEAGTSFDCELKGSQQGDTITFSITKDNDPNAIDTKIS